MINEFPVVERTDACRTFAKTRASAGPKGEKRRLDPDGEAEASTPSP